MAPIASSEADFTISLVPNPHNHEISEVNGLQSSLDDKANSASLNSGLSSKANTSTLSSYVEKAEILVPKVTKLSGPGPFSPTGSPRYIRVRMIGAGSAPYASANSSQNGKNGTSSTFGPLSAGGGGGGNYGGVSDSGGVPSLDVYSGIGIKGNAGGPGGLHETGSAYFYMFGGYGPRAIWRRRGGGKGSGNGFGFFVGAGGEAGLAGVDASPGNSYPGGAGGSGIIEVTEYYQ